MGFATRKRFEPETAEMLAEVLDAAWASLSGTDEYRNPAKAANTRTLLAKYIIEIAKRGERDPLRIEEKALEFLRRGNETRATNQRLALASQ